MDTIRHNLEKLRVSISAAAQRAGRAPEDIRLVAVSKRFPVDAIEQALDAGQLVFGENYIQEAVEKKQRLQHRIKLHFIGHLQSNKARAAAEFCDVRSVCGDPG